MRRLIYRFVGQPPPADATRVQRLRWVRRFYWLNAPGFVFAVLVLVAFGAGTTGWIILGALALIWIQGLISISWRIRRGHTKPRPDV